MSDETERWKEKYLHSLEQQEQLERRWSARLDLLRRGLVRSTLAAEGNDRAVDQCMKEMREVVRTDDMDARLMSLLPRLEKAVLDSEQRRVSSRPAMHWPPWWLSFKAWTCPVKCATP
jgi:diguanylate cyclase